MKRNAFNQHTLPYHVTKYDQLAQLDIQRQPGHDFPHDSQVPVISDLDTIHSGQQSSYLLQTNDASLEVFNVGRIHGEGKDLLG